MSNRRCFKCQCLGHTASDCPNKEIISLAEWEATMKEKNQEEKEAYLIKDEEENQVEVKVRIDEGEMLPLENTWDDPKEEDE